jgi:hypothetical protein
MPMKNKYYFRIKTSFMKKTLPFLPFFIAISIISIAQEKKTSFNIGAEFGLPTGIYGDFLKPGLGGSFQTVIAFNEKIHGTASVGYLRFAGKTIIESFFGTLDTVTANSINFFPIKLGTRIMFNKQLFFHPELGVTISTIKDEPSETSFTFAAGMGYLLSKNFSITARYETVSKKIISFEMFALRTAYHF